MKPTPELKEYTWNKVPSDDIIWFQKAFSNVTVVKETDLLSNNIYVTFYLTWLNFFVRFLVPTILLAFLNVKIVLEVICHIGQAQFLISNHLNQSQAFKLKYNFDCQSKMEDMNKYLKFLIFLDKNKTTLFYDLTRDSIANNFVIDAYSRCLQIVCQIAIYIL